MPVYDFKCEACGLEQIDVYMPKITYTIPCECGQEAGHILRASNVLSDECDVTVNHGLCNPDGTPRRYGFKSEMKAEAKRRGLVNHVEHKTRPDTDKSPHTSRWI